MGIEPTSQPWQGRIIAVILHLHIKGLLVLGDSERIFEPLTF